MNTSVETHNTSQLIRGWVEQPSSRGTFDILFSCCVTIFLCGWTSICISVPPAHHTRLETFWDKWHFFWLAMLGPEFVFVIAVGQYGQARAREKLFHESGFHDWTIKHSFYADMGGVILQPHKWKSFPIDSKQLLYLVQEGYVVYPKISESEIDDKNKADGLTRVITSCQIVWFTLNVVTRPSQALAVTTLEITTLGFIICTLAVTFCWRKKPMDISTTVVVHTDHTIDDILIAAGEAASQPYRRTPLDFVSREEWIFSQLWAWYVNVMTKFYVARRRPAVRPIQHISSFTCPQVSLTGSFLALVMTLAYAAVFMWAWNFEFPTGIERTLWRISSATIMVFTLIVGLLEVLYPIYLRHWPPKPLSRAETGEPRASRRSHASIRSIAAMWERWKHFKFNNSPDKDPNMDLEPYVILLMQPIVSIYGICRLYILVEDLIGLRALPASAFQNVEWSTYLPHI